MSGWSFTRWSALLIIAMGVNALSGNCVLAQISSDGTLPTNSNVVQDGNTFNITEGTQAGSNLFHSFKEFSVPTGFAAFFNNMADIQNIISRVTGSSISNIDGLIKASGTNLFLINPNGIIFGPNARLDISGSFLASTASSFKFLDNLEFSATNPQSAPLLSINLPIGLQYGVNPGSILVQGDGQGISTTIEVQPNQTLALVGGDVSLEGATLRTAGGRIELGSVAGEGLVSLTSTNKGFSLSYDPGIQNYRDIKLSQEAVVDASGEGGGDIHIQGRRISLTSGSLIEDSTLGTEAGGTLLVNGTESVELSGTSSEGYSTALSAQVYEGASGAGGNLVIKTGQLIVRDGALISAETFGTGKGGNLTVTAESMQLIGTSVAVDRFPSSLFTLSTPNATGDAGDLTINTRDLLVRDGARISAETFGAGKGGNLTITAESVQVIGTSANLHKPSPSVLSTSSDSDATGDAGNLTINTRDLLVRDGAQIKTTTFGAGEGGDLAVTAESVQLTGVSFNGRINSGLFANTQGAGNAGNLSITTQELLISKGGFASVEGRGGGAAGSLNITANSVRLDDKATIQANALSGNGGNLNLNIADLLLMGHESEITTSAGTNQKPGNGGNIVINAPSGFIVAAPGENNDITANAFSGSGGKITINTAGLFGIAPLSRQELARLRPSDLNPRKLNTNDITAISQTNPTLNGPIEVNEPGIDPNSGLVELPTIQVDTEVAQVCDSPGYAQSSFIITGRGGLPPNPTKDVLTSEAVDVGWVSLKPSTSRNISPATTNPIATPERILEASGWVINQKGEVVLTASLPTTNRGSWQKPVTCSADHAHNLDAMFNAK